MARKLAAEIDASTALTPTGTDKVMVTRAGGVDHVLVSALDARYVNTAGDTMTGALTVIAPSATGHALRQGSAATVAGVTSTGDVTIDKTTPQLIFDTTATTDDSFITYKTAGVTKFYIQHDAGTNEIEFNNSSDLALLKISQTAVTMANATSVTVPTPTAVNHAVKVVAWDATTGRYAVQGPNGTIEQGETGRRNVSSLIHATLATGTITHAYLERIGSRVWLYLDVTAPAGGFASAGNDILTVPTGFQPDFSNVYTPMVSPTSTANPPTGTTCFTNSIGNTRTLRNMTASERLTLNASWSTTEAWPTSLPGTAA